MSEFDQFWDIYPRRTAKLSAVKAFAKARKLASLEDILSGVNRYIASKPFYADWAHPASWLNAGRWMDEPDRLTGKDRRQSMADLWVCDHTPHCLHYRACAQKTFLDGERAKGRQL